ncbi:MAG: winged helix-turn-helix transcriptional regulator [Candidatus Thorarchaeota archaeon]
MSQKPDFILTRIFGKSVRVKILEILIENTLQKEIIWLNISEIAKLCGISTSSSKRIVDKLIEEGLVDLKPIQTHAKNPEKEIRLNLDRKLINELIFFFRKLKGFT